MHTLNQKRIAAALLCAALLGGCSDPKNYKATSLTEKQRDELLKKLTNEERSDFAAWMLRHAMSGKTPAPETTVAQALAEQDAWRTQQKAEEAKEEALKQKVEAERAAKRAEFAKLITIAVTGKKNSENEYGQQYVSFSLAYENKSEKDIRGVKGVIRVANLFGDKIFNGSWTFDNGLPGKQSTVESGSYEINRFIDTHQKLWETDFEKMKVTFDVQTILFKDGTQINAPE